MIIFTDSLRKLCKAFKPILNVGYRRRREPMKPETNWRISFVEYVNGDRREHSYVQQGKEFIYTNHLGEKETAPSTPLKYNPHDLMWFLKERRHPNSATMAIFYDKGTQ